MVILNQFRTNFGAHKNSQSPPSALELFLVPLSKEVLLSHFIGAPTPISAHISQFSWITDHHDHPTHIIHEFLNDPCVHVSVSVSLSVSLCVLLSVSVCICKGLAESYSVWLTMPQCVFDCVTVSRWEYVCPYKCVCVWVLVSVHLGVEESTDEFRVKRKPCEW